MVNGTVGARALAYPEHEVFFAAADGAALPIAVHFSYEFPGVSDLFAHFFPTRVLAGLFPIMAGFTSVLCTGLMDRYPRLRFAFLEGGCNWVASFVERMDEHYESPVYRAAEVISQRPGELLDSGRIFFGCEGNEPGLGRIIEEIGEDKLLYSSDYPHGDRTEAPWACSGSGTTCRSPRKPGFSRKMPGLFTVNDPRRDFFIHLRSKVDKEVHTGYPKPMLLKEFCMTRCFVVLASLLLLLFSGLPYASGHIRAWCRVDHGGSVHHPRRA